MKKLTIQANCIAREETKDLVTLEQHFEEALRRVRTEFECTGSIDPEFECLTDDESFHVPANWPDGRAKAAAYAALRDSFRRRRVNRYFFISEAWVGKPPPTCFPPMIPITVKSSRFWRSIAMAPVDTRSLRSCVTEGQQR